ncbi:hypothetical protein [Gluconobacter aidae]|nr:hypothetical protein [Gluconobacter aidae]
MRKTLLAPDILFTTTAACANSSIPGMDMSHMDMGYDEPDAAPGETLEH